MDEDPTAEYAPVSTPWYRSNRALIALAVVAGVTAVAAKAYFSNAEDSTPETD